MKIRYNDTVFSPNGTLDSGNMSSNERLFIDDLSNEKHCRQNANTSIRSDFTRYSILIL